MLLKELLTPSTASTRALTEPEHCTGETPPQGHQAQGRPQGEEQRVKRLTTTCRVRTLTRTKIYLQKWPKWKTKSSIQLGSNRKM